MAYCDSMIDQILTQARMIDGKRHERNLVFFSLSTCVMCKKGQEYLEERDYAYKMMYVDKLDPKDKEQLKEELSSRYGRRAVFPALLVDGRRLVLGFVRAAWDKALEEVQDDEQQRTHS